MNKQELIEAIANEVEVTKATAAGCLDAFINTVTKVLKKKAHPILMICLGALLGLIVNYINLI